MHPSPSASSEVGGFDSSSARLRTLRKVVVMTAHTVGLLFDALETKLYERLPESDALFDGLAALSRAKTLVQDAAAVELTPV